MTEKRTYSAEDYEWLAELFASDRAGIGHPTPTVVRPRASLLALSALRIAAAVMRPGTLERAAATLAGLLPEMIHEDEWQPEAGVIRAALLGKAEDTGR